MNACQKGKRGERHFRDELRAAGYGRARRGQQFSGSPDSPDVICEDLPDVHFEVKVGAKADKLALSAVRQAQRDSAGTGKICVAAMKRDREDWIIAMPLSDFFRLLSSLPEE